MALLDFLNERPQLKRILQIVGFVAAAIAAGFAVYFLFFGSPTEDLLNGNVNAGPGGGLPNTNGITNRPTTNENTNGSLPLTNSPTNIGNPDEVASGGGTVSTPLVPTSVTGLTIGPSGTTLQYYDKGRGQFFSMTADGRTKQLLTSATFASVQNLTWSPDGRRVIMEFPDRTKVLYDFVTKQQVTLPEELEDFSFSPDSSKMSFKFLGATTDDQWLAVSNPDGSGAQVIEDIGDKAPFVDASWSPNQQVIATFAHSVGTSQQEVIFIGQYGENFKSLTVNGRGFTSQWSPSGEQLLYSTYDATTNYNPMLSVTLANGDRIGESNQSLNIQTWPDKCVFNGTGSVLCGVPTALPSGAGIQRQLADNVPDDLYEINLNTGTSRLLAQPLSSDGTTHYSITNPRLSETGDQLFFIDGTTGKLLSLRLR